MFSKLLFYTTTGYGDMILPQPWRMVGAVEALVGILMRGWSPLLFRRREQAKMGASLDGVRLCSNRCLANQNK
jgi:hypothetical protein